MDRTFFDKAAAALPDACFTRPPDLAIVLGSGWGDALTCDRTLVRIPYSDIPGFGVPTVAGHGASSRSAAGATGTRASAGRPSSSPSNSPGAWAAENFC